LSDANVIHHPHDKLFKVSLRNKNVAMEFLQAHLPASVLEVVDASSVRIEKNSYVDSRLQSTESDVLLSVRHGKTRALVYVLCEHQSSVDHGITLRLWTYVLQILNDYQEMHSSSCRNSTMPVVFPIVYYNGKSHYHGNLDFFKLFGEYENLAREHLLQPITLVELSEVSDGALMAFNWYSLMALAMKHVRWGERLLSAMEKISTNLGALEQSGGGEYIEAVLKYIVDQGDLRNEARFETFVRSSISHPLGEEVMTLADRYVEKGMQQGMQKGELQGRREEKLDIAKAMLLKGCDSHFISSVTNLSETELVEMEVKLNKEFAD